MELFTDDAEDSALNLDIRTKPDESLNHLSINKEFAEQYLHNKQRAELHQLEARYGKDAIPNSEDNSDNDSDTESDVTEDEDGDQIDAHVDAAIFRTLQRIRNKDASVYDSKLDIFEQESKAAQKAAHSRDIPVSSVAPSSSTTKKSNKVTLQDYQRQRVQELMETSADPAKALAEATTTERRYSNYEDENQSLLPPALEQEQLRKQVSQAFHDGIDASDELFTRKSDSSAQTGASWTYRDAVIASLGPGADEDTIRSAIRDQINFNNAEKQVDDNAEHKANEDFLLNYILNRGWVNSKDEAGPSKPRISKSLLKGSGGEPSEVVDAEADAADGDVGDAYERDWEAEAAELESEASFESMADAFESAYNFRFEQGDAAAVIPTYSRTPKETARRKDNTRKRKREERAARKEEEKHQKMQDLARLKNLKRLEIVEKLKRLRDVTGATIDDLQGIDLENDFDPDAHDRAMATAFGDHYYEKDDDGEGMEKPTWDDDINIDDILADEEGSHSKKKKKKAKTSHQDDQDDGRIEMDADFVDSGGNDGAHSGAGGVSAKEAALQARLADPSLSKKDKKKLKKKLKAAQEKAGRTGADEGVDAAEMDAEQAEEMPATAEERRKKARAMLDDYYQLDYEDVIGDTPTRFKYTSVPSADFGMSAVDILLADDSQLNDVVGLTNLQPYRRGKTLPIDLGKRLGKFRREVYGQSHPAPDGHPPAPPKKRLGKKERQRLKAAADPANTAATSS